MNSIKYGERNWENDATSTTAFIPLGDGYSIKILGDEAIIECQNGDRLSMPATNVHDSIYTKIAEVKEMNGATNKSTTIDKGAKSRLFSTFGDIYAHSFNEKVFLGSDYIMPDIKDVRILTDGNENTGVAVTFTDNTTMKAILNRDEHDVFSLEQGISICITKKLLAMKSKNGESLYNKIVNRAKRFYINRLREERLQLEREEAQAKKREKIARKNRAWWEKKRNKQREEQIEIQKEAYIRAMRELNTASGEVAAE